MIGSRRAYRAALLDRIGEEGMGRSSIYILEGLTKIAADL